MFEEVLCLFMFLCLRFCVCLKGFLFEEVLCVCGGFYCFSSVCWGVVLW